MNDKFDVTTSNRESAMKRGDKVTVIEGKYAGQTGEVITLPIGSKSSTITVRRHDGHAFTCQMNEVEIKEGRT